jgi:hypothetical protein
MIEHLLVVVVPPELLLVPLGAAPGAPVDEGLDRLVNTVDGAEEGAVPDPPAAADSCAKPMDGGLLRNTE